MAFRSSRTATVSSRIPDSISAEGMVAKLHNHKLIIEASPYALGSEVVECPKELEKTKQEADDAEQEQPLPGREWITYLIREKVPYYGTISFHACLKDYPLGHNQVVHAPQGLIMKGHSRVVTTSDGSRYLEDTTLFSVNKLLMPFVIRSWEKAHNDLHAEIFAELEKGDVSGQPDSAQRPTPSQRPSWIRRQMSSFTSKSHAAA